MAHAVHVRADGGQQEQTPGVAEVTYGDIVKQFSILGWSACGAQRF